MASGLDDRPLVGIEKVATRSMRVIGVGCDGPAKKTNQSNQ
jgi:hypothetical protein